MGVTFGLVGAAFDLMGATLELVGASVNLMEAAVKWVGASVNLMEAAVKWVGASVGLVGAAADLVLEVNCGAGVRVVMKKQIGKRSDFAGQGLVGTPGARVGCCKDCMGP